MRKENPAGNEEPRGWRERYDKIVETYSFPVHVLAAAIAVLEIIHSNALTLVKLGLVIWAVYSWYYFFRIVKSKTVSPITGKERPAHSRAARKWALGFMIAIPIIAALYPVFWYWFWPRRYVYFPRKTFVVALAKFEGPDDNKYGVTEVLRDELDKVARRHPDILVEPLGSRVGSQQGSEFARARGEERGAALVLWGWYRVTSQKALLSAHVELLRQPHFQWIHGGIESREVAVANLESFDVQTQQAKDMTYLALLAAATARFEGGGNLGEVLSELNEALAQETAPEQIAGLEYGYFFRCSTYYYLGDTDKAQRDCNQAVKLNPHFAEAWTNLAAISFYKGDLDGALNESDQAIQWKPELAEAYVTRAAVLYTRREYDQAHHDLDRAIELKPDLPNAHDLRGLVYTNLGDFGAALADFDRAIELRPEYAIAYNNRGNVYAKQGRYDLAMEDYNRSLKINPSYPEAYNNRGYAYAQQHQLKYAIRDYREALNFSPNYPDAILNLAVACEEAEDRPCAVSSYESALRFQTDPQQRAAIEAKVRDLRSK